MARRRVSRSQLQSQIRRAEQKQRQAINRYNADVRKRNRKLKQAVDQYNREVRAHNARVRSNRQKLKRELGRLQQASNKRTTTRYVVYQQSVTTLRRSFERVEASAAAGTWRGGSDLLDLAEGETANSVAALNALLAEPETEVEPATDEALQSTSIGNELRAFSSDLYARWTGALFALNPQNPDASRHFCTSAREILTAILNMSAPDSEVLSADPQAPRTQDNRITRRAKIDYCLRRVGRYDSDLAGFVDEDIDNVLSLFGEFNSGTHGEAGRFTLRQLSTLKQRVEDAIAFLYRIVT